jgi:thiamine-phosphate diphosphorylase
MALRHPALCVVTDRRRLPDPTESHLEQLCAGAARAGVDLIHLRERDLDDRRLLALARRIVAAVRGTPTAVVVNDRIDVALAAGAAGVHLRGDGIDAGRVRAIVPAGFLIGRSVHDAAEAAAAAATGVDYLVAGTVYASHSKPADVPLLGADGLGRICRAATVPVLAIGGITADKLGNVAAAGAAGIAAIGQFSDAFVADRPGRTDAGLRRVVADFRRAFAR